MSRYVEGRDLGAIGILLLSARFAMKVQAFAWRGSRCQEQLPELFANRKLSEFRIARWLQVLDEMSRSFGRASELQKGLEDKLATSLLFHQGAVHALGERLRLRRT